MVAEKVIPDKQLFLVKEVAAIARVSERSVRRWVDDGLIEHKHAGRGIRIPRDEVVRIVRNGMSYPVRCVL